MRELSDEIRNVIPHLGFPFHVVTITYLHVMYNFDIYNLIQLHSLPFNSVTICAFAGVGWESLFFGQAMCAVYNLKSM